MSIGHVPRERNIWADDLANLQVAGFDPAKRWDPIGEMEETIVLKDLLIYGRQLGLHLSKKKQEAHQEPRVRLVPASARKPFHGRPADAAQSSPVKRKRQ